MRQGTLRVEKPGEQLDPFFSCLGDAPSRALILDYDGTIAPFCENRDEARPHSAVLGALNSILGGEHSHVSIVSGRAINDLVPLISDLLLRPDLWGSHGWERMRVDGSRGVFSIPESARESLLLARDRASGFIDRCEVKPVSLAVHWRGLGCDERNALRTEVRNAWGVLSHSPAGDRHSENNDASGVLEWHAFDGGVELRVPGRDKGDAVRGIVDEVGPDAVVAYAGDDQTDEDAFAEVGRVGVRGISILVRRELRETCAKVWLESHEELAKFLTRWNKVCTKKP